MARTPRRTFVRPAQPIALIVLGVAGLCLWITAGRAGAAPIKDGMPGTIPHAPPYISGFPIPFYRTTDYRTRQGSVAAADIDRDGSIELVVAVPTGLVSVIRSDGSRPAGWPRNFEAFPQPAYPVGAPAVGDLDGDGLAEIVGCITAGPAPARSFMYAFRADGRDETGWPLEIRDAGDASTGCSEAATVLADLNGDGRREIIRAMSGGAVMAWYGDGRKMPGWPYSMGPDGFGRTRPINPDPTVADLDGDGREEVVLVESGATARLAAIEGSGRAARGYPVQLAEVVDHQSTAVGDLDGDGRPELIQATVPFDGSLDGTGGLVPASLHVMRVDGSALPGWPMTLQTGAPWGALLTDLDRDGRPEILQQDGDLLYGFDPLGTVLPGFPYPVHRDFVKSQGLYASCWVAGDADGDSWPDLVQARSNLYNGGNTLRLVALRAGGQALKGFPFDVTGWAAASNPVLADLTADGVNDLVLLVDAGTGGGFSLVAWDLGALLRGNK